MFKFFKQKDKNVTRTEWIVLGIFFIAFFAVYLYSDICHTTSRGIVFWECLFSGRLNEFYAYLYPGVEGSMLPNGSYSGAYDALFYLIFAIWDFPLWCFEKITGLSFLSVYGGRLYAKCIVLVFLGISAWLLKKIALLVTNNKVLSNWAVFLFISSALTVSAVVVQGGYDIISVSFTLLGIYFYLKGEDWEFVLAFAMAATCKMFSLFVFVPLLLLKHKKISQVISRGLVGISFIALPKLMTAMGNRLFAGLQARNMTEPASMITYMQTDILLASSDANAGITTNSVIAHSNIVDKQMFAGNGAAISFGELPLFFFMTFLFWWICWKKKEVTQYEVIYYCLASMSIFALFVKQNPYWMILLVPYVVLIMIMNMDKLRDNIILDIIFSLGFVLWQAYERYWCYSYEMFSKMIGQDFGVIGNYEVCGFVKIIDKLQNMIGISSAHLISLLVCSFALGLILFLYDNRPGIQKKQSMDETGIRRLTWIRTIPALGVALLPLITAFLHLFREMI